MSSRKMNRKVVDEAFDEFMKWIKTFVADYNHLGSPAVSQRLEQVDGDWRIGSITKSRPELPDCSCTIVMIVYNNHTKKLFFTVQTKGFWAKRRMLELVQHYGFVVVEQKGDSIEAWWYLNIK